MTSRRFGMIFVLLALVEWPAGDARAQPSAAVPSAVHEIIIEREAGTHRILVHPAYVTVLHFPSSVTYSLVSDLENFIVDVEGSQVILRPATDAPPNAVANLHVLTADMKVTIFLRVTPDVDQAVSQIIFRKPEPLPTAVPLGERLSFSISGIYGVATVENPNDSPAQDRNSSATLFGAAARLALTGSSNHSYEAAVTVAHLGISFEQNDLNKAEPPLQTLSTELLLTRLELGVLLYFGERLVPKIRLGSIVQSRSPLGTRRQVAGPRRAVTAREDEPWRYNMLMTGGIGVDIAIYGNWWGGLGINAVQSATFSGSSAFRSIEGAAFVRWL